MFEVPLTIGRVSFLVAADLLLDDADFHVAACGLLSYVPSSTQSPATAQKSPSLVKPSRSRFLGLSLK